ncbi:MAG: EAL domain-containing protein [Candidatus Sumerlaeia bacterium]|nr:EAL domain-containing protein [Candidatus Sumerlaeia bacterium]
MSDCTPDPAYDSAGATTSPPELIRVLLIEDSLADATWVGECLAAAPRGRYEVEHVGTLADGIAVATADVGFDVVLLDLCLPDSRGEQTWRTALEALPGVPVILMTGLEDETMAEEALRDGVQDYLHKRDIQTDLLVRALRYALERQRARVELAESRERYALAARGANDGIWDWDLRAGRIVFSPRWKSMLGFEDFEIDDDPQEWFRRVHPEYIDNLQAKLGAHLRGETTHFEDEHPILHADGKYRWVLVRGLAVIGPEGHAVRMAGSQTDISKRKSAEIQLRHDAMHDALTGLPNRALLLDHLRSAIGRTRRNAEYQFAVLFIDLDRFKIINDSLGHTIGDQVLVEFAGKMRRFLRPGDIAARLGGDEFVVFLNDISHMRDATRVAERIHQDLEHPFHLDDMEVTATASIGIALSATGYDKPEDLLRDADAATYRAKASGRARHEVFDRAMHEAVVSLLRLESHLRRAVERNELLIHYQPFVSLAECRLTGFEALVRWMHPEQGLLSPTEFIPLAEETGLIIPIGYWVLENACRQMALWTAHYPATAGISLSVNLASPQLCRPDFADRLSGILDATGLEARRLKLEITERTIMEPREEVLANLAALRTLGVQLQIDDFGTGYSSLGFLRSYPIDHLKIDRSFVHGMADSGDDLEIVRTITNLASNLRMQVIAEGVETADQYERLRELNVGEGQGFYFSEPLDPAAAERLLSAHAAAN